MKRAGSIGPGQEERRGKTGSQRLPDTIAQAKTTYAGLYPVRWSAH